MIARRRGDTHSHSRWRPGGRDASSQAERAGSEQLLEHERGQLPHLEPQQARRRRRRVSIVIATLIAVAVIAGTQQHTAGGPSAQLPATPQQWVDEWTAASLENPARVCEQLFAPALAAAFKADTGRSCTRHYTLVNTTSFRIRHVLQDGPTATVEARQVGARPRWGYFTIVLSRVHGGWRAVDMVPGGSVRAR